jgi:hypothetical protein
MSREPPDRLEVLKSLVDTAALIARDLNDDPLFERLLRIFARMPAADREIIVGVLEREVENRVLSQHVADTITQVELRPNPKAQLYFRVIEPERKSDVEMLVFLRGMHMVQRGIDALVPNWKEMLLEGIRQMDSVGRAKLDSFNGAVREMLDTCAREVAAVGEGKPDDDPSRSRTTPVARPLTPSFA